VASNKSLACASFATAVAVGACGTPTTSRPTPGPAGIAAPLVVDTIQQFNRDRVREILTAIAGRESEPAGEVFQNVKQLSTTPARTFLAIMNGGYARALGVKCTHCHVEQNYASDEKRPKRAAREMAVMHRIINQQLAGMENIATPRDQNRSINCSTCHRGLVDPRQERR
jgi:hypothetical protein